MNPVTLKDAKKLFDGVKKGVRVVKNMEVVICPPFLYVSSFKFQASSLVLGAQNVFYEEKGAYTGEISPQMLKSSKVDYVIVGHSERRKYFGETNEIVNKKIKKALDANVKVIFCVGENMGDDKSAVLEQQVTEGLKNISREHFKHVAIAYEPVWAIGTGSNCSVDQTLSSILLIRKIISNLYNRELADVTRILYGGSANSKNSSDYIKNAGANGLLVGGASLNAEEFVAIVKSVI